MNINKQEKQAPQATAEKVQYTGLTKVFPLWINPTMEELKSKIGYNDPKEPFAYLGEKDGITQMRYDIYNRRIDGGIIKDTHYVTATKVGKDEKFKFISTTGMVTGSMFATLAEAKVWASNNTWFGIPVREVFEGEEQLYQALMTLIPLVAQKEAGFKLLLDALPYTEKAVVELNKGLSNAGLYCNKEEKLTAENFGVCVVVGIKATDKGIYEEIVKPRYSSPYFKFAKLNKGITAEVLGQAVKLEDKYDKETKSSERQSFVASVFNPTTNEKWNYRQVLQVCAILDSALYNDKYKIQSPTLEYTPYVHSTFTPSVTNEHITTASPADDLPF